MNTKHIIIFVGILLTGFALGYMCHKLSYQDRYFFTDARVGDAGLPFLIDKRNGRVWRFTTTRGFIEVNTDSVHGKPTKTLDEMATTPKTSG